MNKSNLNPSLFRLEQLINKLIIKNTELKQPINTDEIEKINESMNEIEKLIESIPTKVKRTFDNDPKKNWRKADIIIVIVCIIVLLIGAIPQAATYISNQQYSKYFSVFSPFATLIIGYLWGHKN